MSHGMPRQTWSESWGKDARGTVEQAHTPPLTVRRSRGCRDAAVHNVKLVGRARVPDGRQTRLLPRGCSTHQASQASTGAHGDAEARAGDLLDGLTGLLVTWTPAGPVLSPLEWCSPRSAARFGHGVPHPCR